jgi:alkylation response protein AidB-like acyl-CoA dehydrogenase
MLDLGYRTNVHSSTIEKETLVLSEQFTTLYKKIEQTLSESILPLENQYLNEGFEAVETSLTEIRHEAIDQGIWNPHAPKELGGQGISLLEFAHLSELMGQTPLGHYALGANAPDAGNIEILHYLAKSGELSKELNERYLAPLAGGQVRSCFAMTEPMSAGSNPLLLKTHAVEKEDYYEINGHKWFCTGADQANFCIIMAVTNFNSDHKERTSLFIVDTNTPGFDILRHVSVMGHTGHGVETHSEIKFNQLKIPKKQLLGQKGQGFYYAQKRLAHGRIHHCSRWLGIVRRSISLAIKQAKERQISTNKSLAQSELALTQIAELSTRLYAARLMLFDTADKIDRLDSKQVRPNISAIKFTIAQLMNESIDRAIQMHGAKGVSDDTVLSYFYRFERGARIYDGPDEVHLLSLGKQIFQGGLDEFLR